MYFLRAYYKRLKILTFARNLRMKHKKAMTVGRRLPTVMATFKSLLDFRECAKPTSRFEGFFPD